MLNPDLVCAIGVNIGLSKFKVAVVNLGGEIIEESTPQSVADRTPEEILSIICAEVNRLFRVHQNRNILGIGVAFAGNVNSANDVVSHFPGTQPWEHVPLADSLRRKCPGVVEVCPDTFAGLLAELRFGNAINDRNVIYLMMIEGIALGILSNGKIHWGNNHDSGEFGHICVNTDGPFCYCGGTGCLETVASSWAILRQVQGLLEEGVHARFDAEQGVASLTLEMISQAAQAGEPLARNIMTKAGATIGELLAMVANILDPDKIVLAGILSQDDIHPTLVGNLKESFQKGLIPRAKPIDLVHSKFGLGACVRGAAAFVFERFVPGFPANALPSTIHEGEQVEIPLPPDVV